MIKKIWIFAKYTGSGVGDPDSTKIPGSETMVESDICCAVYVVESEGYCLVYLNGSPIKENIFRFSRGKAFRVQRRGMDYFEWIMDILFIGS